MADDRNITGSKVILRAAGMQDQGMLLGLTWDPEIVKVTKGYRSPATGRYPRYRPGFLPVPLRIFIQNPIRGCLISDL